MPMRHFSTHRPKIISISDFGTGIGLFLQMHDKSCSIPVLTFAHFNEFMNTIGKPDSQCSPTTLFVVSQTAKINFKSLKSFYSFQTHRRFIVLEFIWFNVYCRYRPSCSMWKINDLRWKQPPVIARIVTFSSNLSIWLVHLLMSE